MDANNPLMLILTQGPMGLIAGLFIWLYLQERKKAAEFQVEHNRLLTEMHQKHFDQLDGVRQAQIAREQEVARTLDEYGRSVVTAVDQATAIAKELRRVYGSRSS